MSYKKSAVALASLALLAPIANAAQESPELNPIIVYGVGFGEPLAQALPQTEVITRNQIQKSGLNTVGDILEKLGNVFMRQDGNGNMNPSPDIRGYGATSDNNTVVLLDGVRISQNEQAPARISNIPVEAIDHIEIIRGAASVLYGEGGTSGVINIITNSQKENIGVVSMGAGSYNTYTSNAYLSRQLNALKLTVFGKTADSDGYRDQSSSKLRSGGIYLDYALSGNLSMGVKYIEDKNYSLLPGSLDLTRYANSPRWAQYDLSQISEPSNSDVKSQLTSMYGKYRQGDYEYIFDASRRDGDTKFLHTDNWGSHNQSSYVSRQDSISGRLKISNYLWASNVLIAGFSTMSSYRNNSSYDNYYFSSSSSYSTQNGNALFVQDDFRFTNVDRATLGYRKEFFRQEMTANWGGNDSIQNRRKNLDAYEIQYSRDIMREVTNYIKYGQSYRMPNVDDTNKYDQCASSCFGKYLLNPQINRDLEIGSSYKVGAYRGYLKLYRSLIRDEVIFDIASYQVGGNINASKTRRQGVEIFNAYQLSNQLVFNVGANWVDAKFMTNTLTSTLGEVSSGYYGKRVSGTPNYILGLGLDYLVNSANLLSWKTRIVGNQYSQGDNLNTIRLGSYSVTDLSYRLTHKNLAIIANLNNVFDRKYFDSAIFYNSSYVVYPNFARNFMLTAKYSFD